jgi:tetratricopeptide (TPR) repeat protein
MRETESLARNKIIPLIFLVLARVPSLCASRPHSEEPRMPERLDALVSQGVDLTLKQEYVRADSVFQFASLMYPDHPYGYLYRAAVMEAKSIDYLDPLDFAAFDSLVEQARLRAEKMIEAMPDAAMGYYLRGTAIGFDAYAQVDAGNWLGGILKGLSAATDLKKAVDLDSTLYDAYAGVGTYYYWKSRKAEFLNWALGDRRHEGIRLLEIASQKSDHNRFAALSALTAIYLDTKQSDLAAACARQGLQQYPDSRVFLWGLASAEDQAKDYEHAASTYERLLQNILKAKIANPYNEIACRMDIVSDRLALHQTEGVVSQVEAILAYEHYAFPETLAERAKKKFEDARNIRRTLIVQ